MTVALIVVLTFQLALHLGPTSAFVPLVRTRLDEISYQNLSPSRLSSQKGDNEDSIKTEGGREILKPFIPAIDPMYKVRGEVGGGDFVVCREGGPREEELTNENLYGILYYKCSDLEVNTLVWKCLGYRFDAESEEWRPDEVFPKWKEKFPSPPDLIGMQRVYSKEVDTPSLKANQQLVKSIPKDNKQSLKNHLKPMGFTGKIISTNSFTLFMTHQSVLELFNSIDTKVSRYELD